MVRNSFPPTSVLGQGAGIQRKVQQNQSCEDSIVDKPGKLGKVVATMIRPNFILDDLTLLRLQRLSNMCKEMLESTDHESRP